MASVKNLECPDKFLVELTQIVDLIKRNDKVAYYEFGAGISVVFTKESFLELIEEWFSDFRKMKIEDVLRIFRLRNYELFVEARNVTLWFEKYPAFQIAWTS